MTKAAQNKLTVIATTVMLLFLVGTATSVSANTEVANDSETVRNTGEHVVIYNDHLTKKQVKKTAHGATVKSTKKLPSGETIAVLSPDADIEQIKKQDNVELVCDRIVYKNTDWEDDMANGVNDPRGIRQGYLASIGWLEAVKEVKWNKNRPRIAIIDSGAAEIDELANVEKRVDMLGQHREKVDNDGHGTGVASIVGAIRNNNLEMTGICNARLFIYNAIDDKRGGYTNDSSYEAVCRAITEDHVDIINLSLGASQKNDPIAERIAAFATEKDVLVVCAAGNDNSNEEFFPASASTRNNTFMSVGSTGPENDADITGYNTAQYAVNFRFIGKSEFSNYGKYVDVMAPGAYLIACKTDGSTDYFSGTSASAPVVAGCAGLLLQKNPNLTALQLKRLLINTSHAMNRGTCRYGYIDVGEAMKQINNKAAKGFPGKVQNVVFHMKAPLLTPRIPIFLKVKTKNGKRYLSIRKDMYSGLTLQKKIFAASLMKKAFPKWEKKWETYYSNYFFYNNQMTKKSGKVKTLSYIPKENGMVEAAIIGCDLYGQKVFCAGNGVGYRCLLVNEPLEFTASAGNKVVNYTSVRDCDGAPADGFEIKYKYKGKTYTKKVEAGRGSIAVGKHKPTVIYIRSVGPFNSSSWVKSNSIKW